MKQSDIITIVLITMIGTIVAAFAVNGIMSNPDEASETWRTIEVIDESLSDPDPEIFNADAINPTVEVYVGNCEDLDHDEKLSDSELIACGWLNSNKKLVPGSDSGTEKESTTKKEAEKQTEIPTAEQEIEDIIKKRTQSGDTVPTTPTETNANDEQRKKDMERFIAQVEQYRTNNRGSLPTTQTQWNSFLTNYLKTAGGDFKDPSGVDYTIEYNSTSIPNALIPDGVIHLYSQAGCSEKGELAAGATSEEAKNWVALLLKTEEAGYYCAANH